ncbi:hypothetical protein [Azospirillum brasilense]|uniref:hypothetical protein n=1 Tax=Azospirillum brasilense TaxID=192 RepID=UPI000E69F63B|nr:hypothetical protein [Azospirillum brasilense]NUB23327.1 hypothetical protein [Azospirillum brasilense]NUB30949.1 hypothetical protein [Azospirillum brasilense]RIW05668.1 hypothetical protein D2T81_07430 [Azospirillum brasilense]
MIATDIYRLLGDDGFDLIADIVMNAATESDVRSAVLDAVCEELSRLGVAEECVIGIDRVEGWAVSQWRRHHALAA